MLAAPAARPLALAAVLFLAAAACDAIPTPSASQIGASPGGTSASPAPAEPSDSPDGRVELPAGFPLPLGARAEPLLGDDLTLVARWTSDESGAAVYDFYAGALAEGGFRIVGLHPGGAAAILRFAAPAGQTLQLVLTPDGGATRIEVRLDQP